MEYTTKREFKDVRIKVPWGYIAGRWYGNSQVRPILALHGWLDNLGTWETLVPLMPQHIGVLCIDLPGHGLSSHMPRGINYHVINFVHIVVLIMNEYNWQKVSFMGHSMGALVAFTFTALFPQKVDLFVSFDAIKPIERYGESRFDIIRANTERLLIEDERLETVVLKEPPSYTCEELKHLLYAGSNHSVDLENCKYILNRNITQSTQYPDKYYFSRDGRLKNYVEFWASDELALEMARKIVNTPYMVLKGSKASFVNDDLLEIIELLRKQNPHFVLHEVPGTHHVHLNNPQGVAAVLNPFINHYRPARLISWSLTEEVASSATDKEHSEKQREELKPSSKL